MEKQENKHEDLSSTAEDKEAKIYKTLKELEEAFENTSRLYNAEAELQKVISSSGLKPRLAKDNSTKIRTFREKLKESCIALEQLKKNTRFINETKAKIQQDVIDVKQLLMQIPVNDSLLLEEIIKELSRKHVNDNFNTQLNEANMENGYIIYEGNDEDMNKDEENSEGSEIISLSEGDTKLEDYANDAVEDYIFNLKDEEIKDLISCFDANCIDTDKDINDLLETEEQFKNITLGNAKAEMQDKTNYIDQLKQENIDLKTQCEYLKNKAKIRENELLLRIQEYADEKNNADSSGMSSDPQVENNDLMKSTIKDTEKPDPTAVPPNIQQTVKKTFNANKELLHFKKSTKTNIMDEIVMEQAEKRSMEVTHGSNEFHPLPSERLMQIKREKRQQIFDLRRDIDTGIQKFVISRHYHYHHYHYHHHL